MFWFFRGKKEIKKLKEDLGKSFDSVKQDFKKVGNWIDYIDGKHNEHKSEISEIKNIIEEMKIEIENLKSHVSFFGQASVGSLSKQPQTVFNKQTSAKAVQTPVQTAVQTGIFSNLTIMERAIIWTLINSDMKLSYEDIATLLGKNKSTIRGQINAIKQKSEDIIHESKDNNGKKRLYIPENVKNMLIKNVKVRVNKQKKSSKSGKKEGNEGKT